LPNERRAERDGRLLLADLPAETGWLWVGCLGDGATVSSAGIPVPSPGGPELTLTVDTAGRNRSACCTRSTKLRAIGAIRQSFDGIEQSQQARSSEPQALS
jgi:hypothetical protein